jgi:hypothetical protein
MIALWRHLERLKYMNSLGVTTKDDLPAVKEKSDEASPAWQKIADKMRRDVEAEENVEEGAEQNRMPIMA